MRAIGAIAKKELVCRLRSEPLHPIFALSVVGAGAVGLIAFWVVNTLSPRPSFFAGSAAFGSLATPSWQDVVASHRGSVVFFALSLALVTLATTIAPIAAAATLNRERDSRAIESILLTGLGPLTLVLGKLAAALARTLLVLAAALPTIAFAWLFGGVAPSVIGLTALIVVAIATLSAAAALFFSSITRSAIAAVLYGVVTIALATVVAPALIFVLAADGDHSLLAAWLYFNPAISLFAIHVDVVAAMGSQTPMQFRELATLSLRQWQGLPIAHAFVLATAVSYFAFSALLVALTSVVLDPFHALRNVRRPTLPWGARR
jgi:ABC-type transport system involved in multi-copper enzyme maturation permease subunit